MINPLIDPNVAYFLLVVGLVLGVLALFSPGTGILEIGALFALVLAGLGIVRLSINAWALGVLIAGVIPFLMALRFSRRWFYLVIACAAFIVGSIFLFRTPEGGLAVNPFLAAVTSTVAVGLFWLVGWKGLEAIRRHPDISMERLMGAVGEARTTIYREGTVYIHGEEWSARSNTPIPVGAKVRVVGREGLVLVVEALTSQSQNES
ncbi:NfeD family protein [uncultured Thermanaerothrix sp.]|uniref:NfeD family protein n=1 Tax=uncultured Thermanaerothrix sp. TaxID=1195149 RepID=UPI00261640DB|nr:NfeD family protein [uncultured Thermanaerothrix sp.]